MREIGIGVLGFGTVGAGVVEGLLKNGDLIAGRSGIFPIVKKIADLDVVSDRGIALPANILTTDAAAVIEDEEVVIGGNDDITLDGAVSSISILSSLDAVSNVDLDE